MCEFELPDVSLRCFVATQLLLRIYALSSVKFSGLKLWLCKKCDKYEVWARSITPPLKQELCPKIRFLPALGLWLYPSIWEGSDFHFRPDLLRSNYNLWAGHLLLLQAELTKTPLGRCTRRSQNITNVTATGAWGSQSSLPLSFTEVRNRIGTEGGLAWGGNLRYFISF